MLMGRIAVATGTRADWGLLQPLADELCRRGERVDILATNMHLDPRFGNTIDEIRADGFQPVAIPAGGTAAEIMGSVTVGFDRWLAANRPDAIVVLGDRFEMLAVASAAILQKVPIVHIAGGTVSEGAFDNAIRNAITQLAALHLTETPACAVRLQSMGVDPERISVTGAPGVWNFFNTTPMQIRKEGERNEFWQREGRTLLATLHAETLSDVAPREQMRRFAKAVEEVMLSPGYEDLALLITYPNNDSGADEMIEEIEAMCSRLGGERARAERSLGRVRYLEALRNVEAVIGNSSSGIVEVPSAGIPTLDIGNRQKGRERAESVFHCEADTRSIAEGIRKILSSEVKGAARRAVNPYYQPDTPQRMANQIQALNQKK